MTKNALIKDLTSWWEDNKSEILEDEIQKSLSSEEHYSSDEISIQWDNKYLCELNEFCDEFADNLFKGFIQLIKTYKE